MLRNIVCFDSVGRTYEELDEVQVTAGGGCVERGPLLAVCRVHVRTKLNQHLREKFIQSHKSVRYNAYCTYSVYKVFHIT